MLVNIIYQEKEKAYGGANQFIKALKKYFIENGQYAFDIKNADIILFNSMNEYKQIYTLKRKYSDKIFVHRVDGPCKLYNNLSDERDDIVYKLNAKVADATVFQSNYSRDASIKMGCPIHDFECVITNACDKDIFFIPQQKLHSDKIRIIATSYSDNWNKGFRTYQWLDNHLDFDRFEMSFIGRSPCEFKNIRYYSPMVSSEIAWFLQKSDIYISAAINDPCSNAIIEALSCGVPVIAKNSGGNPEIIGRGGLLFSEDEELIDSFDRLLDGYDSFCENIDNPQINEVAISYLTFFDELISERNNGGLQLTKFSNIDYIGIQVEEFATKLRKKMKCFF